MAQITQLETSPFRFSGTSLSLSIPSIDKSSAPMPKYEYQLVRELGHGAFGRVSLVKRVPDGRVSGHNITFVDLAFT